ncbi:MAG: flippase-like domain-containing protein [Actinomycetota bacterium]|nr:flippase-like domain-containing protein [Actinomycetota bacterium]
MSRALRAVLTLVVTGLGTAYLIWKIDVSRTVEIILDARLAPLAAAVALTAGTVWPMAWRWQLLLRAKGIRDRLPWLTRAYFVAYAAGQLLPTSVGGDAVRIFETARRHPGRTGPIAGSVLLERALGGAATLALGGVGFLLAVGRYDVGAYLWLEAAFVVATVLLGVVLFSRAARRPLALAVPLLRRIRLDKPVRAVYEGIHAYRENGGLLAALFGLTLVVQALRILAIWLCGEAAGIDLSWRPYYVMGPMLFLVMLVPFTVNGLAVREAFFVSFLGTLGIAADPAFATGFLFFLVTLVLALPGAAMLLWQGIRGTPSPRVRHG